MKKLIPILMLLILLVSPVFAEYVLQEDADELSYVDWVDPDNSQDGNYSTYAEWDGSATDRYWMNYTIPTNINNLSATMWQLKDDGSFRNISLPVGCLNESFGYVGVEFTCSGGESSEHKLYCWTGSDYTDFQTYSVDECYFYEEAIYWDLEPEPELQEGSLAYLLTDLGQAMGIFIGIIAESVGGWILLLGFISGVATIVYAIGSFITKSGKK